MDKGEFNAWLATALGARSDVDQVTYNPLHPEEGVRIMLVGGHEVVVHGSGAGMDPDPEEEEEENMDPEPEGLEELSAEDYLALHGEDETDEDESDYIEYIDEGEAGYEPDLPGAEYTPQEDEDETDIPL